jgi:hypothetical protein
MWECWINTKLSHYCFYGKVINESHVSSLEPGKVVYESHVSLLERGKVIYESHVSSLEPAKLINESHLPSLEPWKVINESHVSSLEPNPKLRNIHWTELSLGRNDIWIVSNIVWTCEISSNRPIKRTLSKYRVRKHATQTLSDQRLWNSSFHDLQVENILLLIQQRTHLSQSEQRYQTAVSDFLGGAFIMLTRWGESPSHGRHILRSLKRRHPFI